MPGLIEELERGNCVPESDWEAAHGIDADLFKISDIRTDDAAIERNQFDGPPPPVEHIISCAVCFCAFRCDDWRRRLCDCCRADRAALMAQRNLTP